MLFLLEWNPGSVIGFLVKVRDATRLQMYLIGKLGFDFEMFAVLSCVFTEVWGLPCNKRHSHCSLQLCC